MAEWATGRHVARWDTVVRSAANPQVPIGVGDRRRRATR
jgi:hypothetical protein